MKILISLTAIVLLACSVSSANDFNPPHITVFGTAVTKVIPDRMTWNLTVKNKGKELQNVATQHTSIVETVLTFLQEQEIADENIQTEWIQFGEEWTRKDGSQIQDGYFASTTISFELEDFSRYTQLWIGLSSIESVSVYGILYDYSQRIASQNTTRQQAVLAAKEKALTLAKTLGMKIGEPLVIEEESSHHTGISINRQYIGSEDVADSLEGAVAPGTIPIKMRVKVTFELISSELPQPSH